MANQKERAATKSAGTHVEAKAPRSERRQIVLASTDRVKSKTPVSVAKVRGS